MAEPMDRYDARPLSGEEALPQDTIVCDFWRWMGSNLVENTARGFLAEYLVGLAVGAITEGDAGGTRQEWEPYDFETPDGVKIEVKSAAYCQSWQQKKVTTPRFRIARTYRLGSAPGQGPEVKRRWSNVYVFCLLDHRDKGTLNPLDVGQWTFFVLSTAVIDKQVEEQDSIGLRTLQKLKAEEVSFDGIADAVRKAGCPVS